MKNSYKGAIALLLAGFMYALQAIFPKYLSIFLNPYEAITIRFVIAFLVVSLIALVAKKISFESLKKNKKSVLIYALAFPASAILFTVAVFHTKVSLAIFSFYIANVLSSFMVGAIFLKERFSTIKIASLIFILVALISFTNPFNGFSLDTGFLIGLVSGFVQTLAVMHQKKIADGSRTSLVFFQTGIGTLMGIVVILFTRSPIHFVALPVKGVIIAILYGVSFAAVSYLMVYGFKYAKLTVGTILVSSELLFGPLLAFFIFAEKLTSLQLAGGVATIIAIVFSSIKTENS